MKFLLVAVYDSDLNECILGFYLKERTKWIYEGQTYPEAKVMQIQQNELIFSIDDIVQGIDSNITKELVRYIYMGNDVTLFENRDSYSSEGVIVTSDEDEVITTSDADNKIVLNKGGDKLVSGKGHNTFYFRVGDGIDIILDDNRADYFDMLGGFVVSTIAQNSHINNVIVTKQLKRQILAS